MFAPFTNYSTALFMKAYFSGMDTKSEEHANTLAKVMEDPAFLLSELKDFSAQRENARLDKYIREGGYSFRTQDGWHEATIFIRLPIEGQRFDSEDKAPRLPMPGFFHRRITDIIRSVCASQVAQSFHFTPYTMHWIPDPNNPDKNERIYGDTYSSDVMVEAQTEVDNLPRMEGDTRERVALGLMMASDCAHLTNFGSASVWPIYLMFANQPKRERAKPSCHAVHHLAYAPSVSYHCQLIYALSLMVSTAR
jgi:Plavaka transposase